MTLETLNVLRHLVVTHHLNVDAPQFVEAAQALATALAEVDDAIAEHLLIEVES